MLQVVTVKSFKKQLAQSDPATPGKWTIGLVALFLGMAIGWNLGAPRI